MKILSWNVRGCNSPKKLWLIKRGLDQPKLDVVLFQETTIKIEDLDGMNRRFGKRQSDWVATEGAPGGTSVLWKVESVIGVLVYKDKNW